MKKEKTIDEAVQEAVAITNEFKERNGDTALRISNKSFNLWIIKTLLEQNGRITKVETKQQHTVTMLLVVTPLVALLISLLV